MQVTGKKWFIIRGNKTPSDIFSGFDDNAIPLWSTGKSLLFDTKLEADKVAQKLRKIYDNDRIAVKWRKYSSREFEQLDWALKNLQDDLIKAYLLLQENGIQAPFNIDVPALMESKKDNL